MKKIKEFQEKDHLEQPLLVKEVKNGMTSKGAPYLSLTLADSSGTIDSKFWDVSERDVELCQVGKICIFVFEIINYNQNLQAKVVKVSEANDMDININDYTAASEISLEEREKELKAYIQSIQNTNYRKLVEGLLNKVGNKFFTYPAASKIHHSFLGGLSEHSLSMARMCDKIAEHYPQLDRDLLVSGALVHDIGKTSEMSGPITTEYTLEGKLEGHISIANGWLTEVADELGLAQEEEAILLHHMILSHHGHLEFGSPVLPLLQEAEVLCLIDNLDARLNTLKTALDGVKEGSWTSKLFALENRQFYKQRKK